MSILVLAIRGYRAIPGRWRTTCPKPHNGLSCSERGLELARAGATLTVIAAMVASCAACNPTAQAGTDPGHTGTPRIRHFARLVMEDLGAPAHGPSASANVDSFAAWAGIEGSTASWNPLDTTQPEPGSSNFNTTTDGTSHVQNYASAASGAQATADTIAVYSDLKDAFTSGAGVCGGGHASSFHCWSAGCAGPPGDGYTEVC